MLSGRRPDICLFLPLFFGIYLDRFTFVVYGIYMIGA